MRTSPKGINQKHQIDGYLQIKCGTLQQNAFVQRT